jgi:hypothetical protein
VLYCFAYGIFFNTFSADFQVLVPQLKSTKVLLMQKFAKHYRDFEPGDFNPTFITAYQI